jgi:branched-chain amino acid transport system ATP-binding protein
MALLEVADLSVKYGRATAVKSLTFSCDAGEVVSLVGPNGAGKTSSLMAIAGALAHGVAGTIYGGCGRGPLLRRHVAQSFLPEPRDAVKRQSIESFRSVSAATRSIASR